MAWKNLGILLVGLAVFSWSSAFAVDDPDPVISDDVYDETITRFENLFSDEVEAQRGLPLKVLNIAPYSPFGGSGLNASIGKGTDADGNGRYSIRAPQELAQFIFGGLTKDGFSVILCHQLGYFLGGDPSEEISAIGGELVSIRGQADYYATADCLKKVFTDDPVDDLADVGYNQITPGLDLHKYLNGEPMFTKYPVPGLAAEKCAEVYDEDSDEYRVCQRSITASIQAIHFTEAIELYDYLLWDNDFAHWGVFFQRMNYLVDLATPDQTVVTETIDYRPSLQCRLDTLVAGALCPQSECTVAEGYEIGVRPACWYAPPAEEEDDEEDGDDSDEGDSAFLVRNQ